MRRSAKAVFLCRAFVVQYPVLEGALRSQEGVIGAAFFALSVGVFPTR